QLQRMPAGRQVEIGLGLTCNEMHVILVRGDRFVGIERLIHIDQQMMVATVGKIVTRVRHAHMAEPKTAPESTLDDCAVRGRDEIQKRVLCGSFPLCLSSTRYKSQSRDQRN